MPADREKELLENYNRERAGYEATQLMKMRAMKSGAGPKELGYKTIEFVSSSTSAPPLSYLESSTCALPPSRPVESNTPPRPLESSTGAPPPSRPAASNIGPYEDPVDVVRSTAGKAKLAKKLSASPVQKRLSVGVSGSPNEDYSTVFNTLPKGKTETIILPRTTRTMSDSNPFSPTPAPLDSKNSPGHVSGQVPGQVLGSVGNVNEFTRKSDETRQSLRKTAKEVVEFDPNKQRKFRMTSTKGRSSHDGGGGGGGGGGDQENSPSWKKAIEVEIDASVMGGGGGGGGGGDGGVPLSYALVNLVDKKKNRPMSNITKSEGSGPPQHYMVSVMSS